VKQRGLHQRKSAQVSYKNNCGHNKYNYNSNHSEKREQEQEGTCDGDAIAGADPIGIVGNATGGLIQGLLHAAIVVNYQAAVDQELINCKREENARRFTLDKHG